MASTEDGEFDGEFANLNWKGRSKTADTEDDDDEFEDPRDDALDHEHIRSLGNCDMCNLAWRRSTNALKADWESSASI